MMTYGERLRQLRIQNGREIEDIAAALGVSPATLLAWEADIESPSAEQLTQLAAELGVDRSAFDAEKIAGVTQGICQAVDLTPEPQQAEILEQVGLPPQLWRDADTWVAFLRLAAAASKLNTERLLALAQHAETCVASDTSPLPHSRKQ
jgi:transcriptional regulator with XRE-family HTH domain